MGIKSVIGDFFKPGSKYSDYEDEYEYEDEEEEELYEDDEPEYRTPFFKRAYAPKRDNVVSFDEPLRRSASEAAKEITIVKIKKPGDANYVAEVLKNGGPVIFDVLELENTADAKSVVDFISGVVCGIGGKDRRVSGGIFMATPPSMTIKVEENPRAAKSNIGISAN